jgi:hypothetical protein
MYKLRIPIALMMFGINFVLFSSFTTYDYGVLQTMAGQAIHFGADLHESLISPCLGKGNEIDYSHNSSINCLFICG